MMTSSGNKQETLILESIMIKYFFTTILNFANISDELIWVHRSMSLGCSAECGGVDINYGT